MNPPRISPPRLPFFRTLALVCFAIGAAAAPQSALAQRASDLTTARPAAGAPNAAGALGGTRGKAPAATSTLSPQLLQQLEEASAAQAAAQTPKTPLQRNAPWLTHIFGGIFIVSALGLVLLLAFQTTKQEGLSGTIGGRVEAAYRPRLGFDQQLQRVTSIAAITFVIFATIVSLSGI